MEAEYQKIIDFMLSSGKRIADKAGKTTDIGTKKKDVTEEDFAIERGFKKIISKFKGSHAIYAEEENFEPQSAENIWIVDPISGTANFIEGRPHYSIVISHLIREEVVFAAVYDPSNDELYTAEKGKGAYLNEKEIKVSSGLEKIVLFESQAWKQPSITEKARNMLKTYSVEENPYSVALKYCWMACGKYDGSVSFTKDSFPEFAGSLIVKEAGGVFTNLKGESTLDIGDRTFIGGNRKLHAELLPLIKGLFK